MPLLAPMIIFNKCIAATSAASITGYRNINASLRDCLSRAGGQRHRPIARQRIVYHHATLISHYGAMSSIDACSKARATANFI